MSREVIHRFGVGQVQVSEGADTEAGCGAAAEVAATAGAPAPSATATAAAVMTASFLMRDITCPLGYGVFLKRNVLVPSQIVN